jgi:beta-galactosidase
MGANKTKARGESRTVIPPAIEDRSGVVYKEAGFNDSAWDRVSLPHDFIMDNNYSKDAESMHGYLARSVIGWYRKAFALPESWVSTSNAIWLHFEGCFQVCDVFLNDKFLLRHTSGYLGFDVRLNNGVPGLLRFGPESIASPNVLAVRSDASFGSGHWYEGGGLYRSVYLLRTPTTMRFATDGLVAQSNLSTVSSASATIVPTAEVVTDAPAGQSAFVKYELVDPVTSTVVTTAQTPVTAVPPSLPSSSSVSPAGTVVSGASLSVLSPRLWSVRSPSLYTLVATLFDAASGNAVDSLNVTIGLRSIEWSAHAAGGNGFALNGKPLNIRGFSVSAWVLG